jgi:hypothetical protein
MSRIERITAKGQLVPFVFNQDALAASQSDVQLGSPDGAGATGIAAPFGGEVVAVTADLTAAGSAGTLSVGASIGGTEVAASTLAFTDETSKRVALVRGTAEFNAGDLIGVEITTDGTWNGTTADLTAVVWCLLYLDGI